MFKDDYTKQIEAINPDGYIKAKVMSGIKNGRIQTRNNFGRIIYRVAFAAIACVAMVCSIWVFNGSRNTIAQQKDGENATTYSDIYDKVKSFKPKYNLFADFATKNSAAEVSENYTSATGDSTAGAQAKQDARDNGTYSETTKQVEGVDESDIVKTDGKFIYSLSTTKGEVRIFNVQGETPKQLGSIKTDPYQVNGNMYLSGDRLVIIGIDVEGKSTVAMIYDVSDPSSPKKLESCKQSGYYNDSRLIGDKLYLITDYYIDTVGINRNSPETYIPQVKCGNYDDTVTADSILMYSAINVPDYSVVCGYSIKDSSLLGTQSVLGGYPTVYCSKTNIITASSIGDKTEINRFEIDDGKVTLKATGKISGYLLNQFSIDEYKGYFRFVTTVYGGNETRNGDVVAFRTEETNSLYVLNKDLKQTGIVENLAPNERVYSVRFMGDMAYFVTFRQTDPLFSADLSDPSDPKIVGSLKIPGFSNYLFPYGDGQLLGIGRDADETTGAANFIKLSMFDISNPANVSEYAKTSVNSFYSEALYNHKACLVDTKKNLIAFPTYGTTGTEYVIYSFVDDGFVKRSEIKFDLAQEGIRGLYIGEKFYIVTENEIVIYDMNDFKVLNKIQCK